MRRRPLGNSVPVAINRYINSAYDNVLLVAENLEAINTAAENIEFLSSYLGDFEDEDTPTERPDGSPLETGDFYYSDKATYYYNADDDTWTEFNPEELLTASANAIDAATRAEEARDVAVDAEEKASSLISGTDIGDYEDDPTFNNILDYVVFGRGTSEIALFKVEENVNLPYTVDSTTNPHPTDDDNLRAYTSTATLYTYEETTYLTDGQVVVDATSELKNYVVFLWDSASGERERLDVVYDYTTNNSNQIVLTDTYPVGSIVTIVFEDIGQNSDTYLKKQEAEQKYGDHNKQANRGSENSHPASAISTTSGESVQTAVETIKGNNELSNSNFLVPSPDDITHPSSVATAYNAGTQIFSGVYAGVYGCTVTYINGQVTCTAGSYEYRVPNTNGLEYVPAFSSSVAGYDGLPKQVGVSHTLVNGEYVIRVTPEADSVFTVKFEQGSTATSHFAGTGSKEEGINRQKETTGLSGIDLAVVGMNLFDFIGQGIRSAGIGVWVVPSVTTNGTPIPNPALLDAIPTANGAVTVNDGIEVQLTKQSTVRFNTLADALKSTSVSVGQVIETLRTFNVPTSGITCDVVLTSTVTPDGYSVIQSTANPELSFVLRLKRTINVEKFGAVAGSAESTTAIQSVIDYLHSNGGGECLIPDYFSITSLTHKRSVSIVGLGKNRSGLDALASASNGILELDAGQVEFSNIKKLSIRGNEANINQWGLLFEASDSEGVGGWWQSQLEDVSISNVNFGIHLKGGVDDALHPHQFLTFKNVTVKRNDYNGEALRMSGQVDQVESINCLYDAVTGTTQGVNIVLDVNSATNPGATIGFKTCTTQNANQAFNNNGFTNVTFENGWFENIATSITTSGLSRGIAFIGNRFANAGSTQIMSLAGTGLITFTGNYILGTAAKLATVGTSIYLDSHDNYFTTDAASVTTGVSKQISVSSNSITVDEGKTFLVSTSASEISTIVSRKSAGESIFIKALAGTIVFNNTGNIQLGTQSSPFTVLHNQVVQFIRFDLTSDWQLVSL